MVLEVFTFKEGGRVMSFIDGMVKMSKFNLVEGLRINVLDILDEIVKKFK